MKRAAAACLVLGALAAYAQPQPDNGPAPQPESPAETAPIAPAPDTAAAPQSPAPAQSPRRTAPAAAKPAPKPPPAAQPPADEGRDAQLSALRGEVSRLESALDAERAAALTAAEEAAAAPRPRGGMWGWLALAMAAALAAGFALGWRMLDRRIRRRYGGLRIY